MPANKQSAAARTKALYADRNDLDPICAARKVLRLEFQVRYSQLEAPLPIPVEGDTDSRAQIGDLLTGLSLSQLQATSD